MCGQDVTLCGFTFDMKPRKAVSLQDSLKVCLGTVSDRPFPTNPELEHQRCRVQNGNQPDGFFVKWRCMHGVDATAETLSRLTSALDGVFDSLIVPLETLVGCFIAGVVFALCAFACYKIPQYCLPGVGSETFRRSARIVSVTAFLGLSFISLVVSLSILLDAVFSQ